MITIQAAKFPNDLAIVRGLFCEYAKSLNIDLGFQDFDTELATLPGKYEPPAGRIMLALKGSNVAGCVALRPIDGKTCEMKRLYVRPSCRGEQLGRTLATRICQEARAAGYAKICLDTLSTMTAARQIYTDLGFKATEPYVFNPIPGAVFLALDL
ncbi:GNAT family N-acetyltransferase [Alcaligenaceae bacterium]|nr:GNAT family N-acetyltransferase [Alcaligenaceae bacterium]